jgi:hypothetical protein
MRGDAACFCPFKDGAGFDPEMLSGLFCGEPNFHELNSRPDASQTSFEMLAVLKAALSALKARKIYLFHNLMFV